MAKPKPKPVTDAKIRHPCSICGKNREVCCGWGDENGKPVPPMCLKCCTLCAH